MKKVKIFACLLFLGVFLVAALGCGQSGAAGGASLNGAIKKTDSGEFVLTASGKMYVLEGQQDFAPMAGKFVKVKGTVSEKDGKAVLAVASISE
jgi:hypothetical protein